MDTDKNDSVVLILWGKKCNFYIEQVSSGKNSNLLFNLVLFFWESQVQPQVSSNTTNVQDAPMAAIFVLKYSLINSIC